MSLPRMSTLAIFSLARLAVVVATASLMACQTSQNTNTVSPTPTSPNANAPSNATGEDPDRATLAKPDFDHYHPDRKAIKVNVHHDYGSGSIALTSDGSLLGKMTITVRKDDETSGAILYQKTFDAPNPPATGTFDPSSLPNVRKLYVQVLYDGQGLPPSEALLSHKERIDVNDDGTELDVKGNFHIFKYYGSIRAAEDDKLGIRSSGTFTTPIGFTLTMNVTK